MIKSQNIFNQMSNLLDRKKINLIFEIFQKNNPEPITELDYNNNLFCLLCSVVLSAQSTDRSVNIATKALYEVADNPEDMHKLGEEGVKEYIKTIGLYNTKARNLIKLSHILSENYNGKVPLEFDELIKLPGVGRKTANVILNCWLGLPTMPVDTHVFRVAHRIGFSNSKTPEKVEMDLLESIPSIWMKYAHHWFILHGRYVCTAKKPKCNECKISHLCSYIK